VGAGTRTFAWLGAANNAGIAIGAGLAGVVIDARGAAAAIWVGVGCALAGTLVAVATRATTA
jgi:predicted MFS family arabinose efflux permease